MSSANDPAGNSGHGDGGPPRKDKGKGKAPASNDDSAQPHWHFGAAGNDLPGTSGSDAFPSRQGRAAESFDPAGDSGSQGNGAAQPTEPGLIGEVDDPEERRIEQMRRLLTTGHILLDAAQNPVHGPQGYNDLQGSEINQSADPEQEESDEDEDGDYNGVPPTQAGSSRDPPPKEESKKPSKKGDPSRPHKCPEPGCAKEKNGFKRPDHLVRHMFDHYDEPYICERSGCDTKARRKDKIKDHLMRKHDLDDEQAKTEANALALAALSRLTRITADIKQRLAAQPVNAGNQVADPEEEEAGQVDEADDELDDSENAGEDNTQSPLNGEASPEDPTRRLHAYRLIARYDDVSSDESSDDGEDSSDEASGRPLMGKRPRDNSDDDRVGRKRVKRG